MAIISKLPGLSVEVRVAGQTLREYPDPDVRESDEDMEVTRYIEAPPEAIFTVEVEKQASCEPLKSKQGVSVWLLIDGKKMRSKPWKGNDLNGNKRLIRSFDGTSAANDGKAWVRRSFQFGKLNIG